MGISKIDLHFLTLHSGFIGIYRMNSKPDKIYRERYSFYIALNRKQFNSGINSSFWVLYQDVPVNAKNTKQSMISP